MPYGKRATYRKRLSNISHSYRHRNGDKRAGRTRTYINARRRRLHSRMGVPASMPNVRTARMRFCTNAVLSCGGNTLGFTDLYANAPNLLTASNERAFGWASWASLFDRYICVGSKITAYASYQTQSATNPPMCVGIYLSDDQAVPYNSWKGLVEARKGTYRNMTALQERPVVVKSFFSCKKFFNITDPKDNMVRFGSATGGASTPDGTAVYIIWGNSTGSTTPETRVNVNVNIVMDFIVRFMEPKDLPRG